MTQPTDKQIRDRLVDLDEAEEVTVTSWEAGFIESVVYKNRNYSMSEAQRTKALQILERYGY